MAAPVQNINNAIAAYSQAVKSGVVGNQDAGMAARDVRQGGEDFASLVKGAIDEAIKINKESEKLSIAAVNDKADLNQVVTAVAEAELTLQTVVAVRDKVIEAYKEIIRMPM